MKAFDAAIVGAGIVGAACAAALSREGLSVVMIDGMPPATGTTAAGMGHIVVMDDSEAQLALTQYSQELWRKLATELPAACEYENCGTIWVAADDLEMNAVRRKYDLYRSRGLRGEVLDADSLRDAEPNLGDHLVGGLLVTQDAVVYQLTATRFLTGKATGSGAEMRIGQSVAGINEGTVTLDNGERVSAKIIVNAAGAAAGVLSPQLKIRKRRGHLVITERCRGFVRHQLVELGYLSSAHGRESESVAFNIQPRITGQILLGSSRQFENEDIGIDEGMLRKMTSRAFEYMPKLRELTAVRVWTGFRPATPDNLPYIGKIEGFENIFAAAGHEGLGITTSLGTAELLTDQILGREPAIPGDPYLPTRKFTEN